MSESTMTIDKFGTIHWRNSVGEYHRLDGPAVEYASGTKIWYQNGQRHRIDGPTHEYLNADPDWYYKQTYLGEGLDGFWKLWEFLNEEERQNVNLHMWLARLTNG